MPWALKIIIIIIIIIIITAAALVALLHKMTDLLDTNSYVVVVALDFTRAFYILVSWKRSQS